MSIICGIMSLMPILRKLKLIGISVFFLIVSINLIRGTLSLLQSSKRLEDMRREVAYLRQEKERLEAELEYKETQAYVEEKARNDLNMARPGEHVYVYTEDANTGDFSANQQEFKTAADKKSVLGAVASDYTNNDPTWYMWYRLFFSF